MAALGIPDAALKNLRAGLAGEAITPDDPGYEEAREIFNAMIEKRPAVIVQCRSSDDAAQTIRFARHLDREIAVRCGGHSVAGMALTDGGVVIDLRRMNGVTVDRDGLVARVGGGATIGDLDRATQPFHLVTTGGRASTIGLGGFVLGGGSGWIEREFGLACDNLMEVQLVTAEGRFVRASETENPELFWALHGGGGNFGVATWLTLRLHAIPAFSIALLLFAPEAGADALYAYREFIGRAPDEIGGGLIHLTAPDEEFVPRHMAGKLTCAVLVTYIGTENEIREVAAPMLGLGHQGELITQLPYADLQCMLDDPPGYRNYCSAEYVVGMPDELVQRFSARAADMIVPSRSRHALFPMGGQVARGDDRYPVPWRRAPWAVHPFGLWARPEDDVRGKQWVRDVRADAAPWSSGAVHLNFIGREGQERVVAGLGEENYQRLVAVKTEYDPDNVFHLNHNIKPA
ncbi:FAD-binding oxidoreductase [Streptomyces sannanensis]|uniref:FAD-binding oxidoreductase n=1 Tax=Streptomyces sannanensis TaxID=285536 RepID=A0ABP6SHY6_9ACTN